MTEINYLAPSASDAAVVAERLAAWVIGALSAVVIGGVAIVIYVPRGGHAGGSSWLPAINASLNGTAAVLLGTGYGFIRRRRIAAHRTCMIAAFAASSLFLITYLIHHAQVGSVPFHGAAWLRPVYFGLLVPHIVLAALVVPLALTTIYRAWCGASTVTGGSRV
jgi:putative membrane protein